MGASAKKALKKELNKIPSSTPLTDKKKSSSGFLGGPGRKLLESTGLKNKSGVLYIGRIPHGFYEEEMKCGKVLIIATILFADIKLKENTEPGVNTRRAQKIGGQGCEVRLEAEKNDRSY